MLTYEIPPEFRGGVHLSIYNRHAPLGQSRVYPVAQLRTDGVHCRESAGTGPVNLKVVPNECCLGRSPWTNQYSRLSHTHYWYEVGMLKTPAVCPHDYRNKCPPAFDSTNRKPQSCLVFSGDGSFPKGERYGFSGLIPRVLLSYRCNLRQQQQQHYPKRRDRFYEQHG